MRIFPVRLWWWKGEIKHWKYFTFEEELYKEVVKNKADFDKISTSGYGEEYQTGTRKFC